MLATDRTIDTNSALCHSGGALAREDAVADEPEAADASCARPQAEQARVLWPLRQPADQAPVPASVAPERDRRADLLVADVRADARQRALDAVKHALGHRCLLSAVARRVIAAPAPPA